MFAIPDPFPEGSEARWITDEASGRRLVRWTGSPQLDRPLYFTSASVTADDRFMAFLSQRDGHPNLWRMNRQTGIATRVSTNNGGMAKAYVYPHGEPGKGVSKSSPCLHAPSGELIWIENDKLMAANITEDQPTPRVVADLPAGWLTGFTHIDPTGRLACVPVAEPACHVDQAHEQDEQMGKIVERFVVEGLVSRLLVIDLRTGQYIHDRSMPFWITHVQFHPTDPTRMIFNMEGGWHIAIRIWRWDLAANAIQPLYPQPVDQVTTHENWAPEGDGVVFHGFHREDRRGYVERRDWNGKLLAHQEIAGLPIWHATPSNHGAWIIDSRDGWLYRVHADGSHEKLCRHHFAKGADQDRHPHPLATPSGRGVVFCLGQNEVGDVGELPLDD